MLVMNFGRSRIRLLDIPTFRMLGEVDRRGVLAWGHFTDVCAEQPRLESLLVASKLSVGEASWALRLVESGVAHAEGE